MRPRHPLPPRSAAYPIDTPSWLRHGVSSHCLSRLLSRQRLSLFSVFCLQPALSRRACCHSPRPYGSECLPSRPGRGTWRCPRQLSCSLQANFCRFPLSFQLFLLPLQRDRINHYGFGYPYHSECSAFLRRALRFFVPHRRAYHYQQQGSFPHA